MKFNVNDNARIELTASGANLINTKQVNVKLPDGASWAAPGMVIEEQLWIVMELFGPYIRLGRTLFRTEIELVEPGPGIDPASDAVEAERERIRRLLLVVADSWSASVSPVAHNCAAELRRFASRSGLD